MEVIALVGPSGTGKSHRALVVAHQYKADAIIDDGILIKDGKIVAGQSAKREASKIMAVRRAIFIIPGHAEEVRKAIEEVAPHRMLVLATSENMAFKIASKLGLPTISRVVRIEDIATKEEMAKARDCRVREGKHIIPVPTIEVRPHFSGYLIDPIESFFKKSRTRRRRLGEKSIVRPIFSYYGKLIIDDSVFESLIEHAAAGVDSLSKVVDISIRHVMENKHTIAILVNVDVIIAYGIAIAAVVRKLQETAKQIIETTTGMVVQEINVTVSSLAARP